MRISAGSASEVKFVEANRDQQEYELNMTRLEPGETYTVNIIAQVMEKSSEAKTIEVTTSKKSCVHLNVCILKQIIC